MMDQNKPARFLDTAYNALKANPNATNQILQAAAKGAPVGLRGLAAAAAQQNQQEAQKAVAAQQMQAQGPQASVIQKLASMPGIMGQLPASMQLASAPTGPAPEEMPQQMMATGGLVSFADGGNVLPPDVIDAIQSHFAEGGDVGLSDFERRHPEVIGDTIGSRWDDVLASHVQTDRDILGDIADRWKDTIGHHAQTDRDVLDPIIARWKAMHEGHVKNSEDFSRGLKQTWEESTSPIGGPIDRTHAMPESDYRLLEERGAFGPKPPGMLDKISSYIQSQTPRSAINAGVESGVEPSAPTEQDLSALDRLIENYPRNGILAAVKEQDKRAATPAKSAATPTWQADPDPYTGTPATPKAPVHEEGANLDKTFEQAKVDTGEKTTDKAAETSGLGALGMEEARDLIANLRGHKTLDPTMAAKLEDLQSSARTSTILQSLLGGLAGGLSNPYGGRYALGSAALGALGGYQKGSTGEEEIGRQAFNILRGYADAPAEEQAAAADKLLGIKEKAAERQSAQDIAEAKGYDALYKTLLQGGFARERANIYAGATQGRLEQTNMKLAEDEYNDWLSQRAKELRRPTEEEKANKRLEFYRKYNIENLLSSMGGGALGGGNMGAGTPAPIILRKSQ